MTFLKKYGMVVSVIAILFLVSHFFDQNEELVNSEPVKTILKAALGIFILSAIIIVIGFQGWEVKIISNRVVPPMKRIWLYFIHFLSATGKYVYMVLVYFMPLFLIYTYFINEVFPSNIPADVGIFSKSWFEYLITTDMIFRVISLLVLAVAAYFYLTRISDWLKKLIYFLFKVSPSRIQNLVIERIRKRRKVLLEILDQKQTFDSDFQFFLKMETKRLQEKLAFFEVVRL